MIHKSIVLGGAMLVASAAGVANATELKPVQAQPIEVGSMKGVAYYTVEKDGYRVVATLADSAGKPVRFIGTLAPGQKLSISVPREPGTLPVAAEIARSGNTVLVTASTLTQ